MQAFLDLIYNGHHRGVHTDYVSRQIHKCSSVLAIYLAALCLARGRPGSPFAVFQDLPR